jgi:hypothetical protein
MELKPLLFIALIGCSGAPFELTHIDAIGRSEDAGDTGAEADAIDVDAVRADAPEEEPADARATLDVTPPPDAGHDVDAGFDGSPDAPPDSPPDAGRDVGVDSPLDSPPDAAPDAPSTTCTPITQTAFTCGGQAISSPYQFCAYNLGTGVGGALAMPAACQCAETFTCACLLMVESPCGGLVYHGCVVDPGFRLTVTCS